jgi:REP element-mobilizing transposase RayT
VSQTDPYFQVIIDNLDFCRIHKGPFLLAYVIMPTHLHLVTGNEGNTTLSDIMRDFRQFTSRNIRKLLEADGRQIFLDIFRRAARRATKFFH